MNPSEHQLALFELKEVSSTKVFSLNKKALMLSLKLVIMDKGLDKKTRETIYNDFEKCVDNLESGKNPFDNE